MENKYMNVPVEQGGPTDYAKETLADILGLIPEDTYTKPQFVITTFDGISARWLSEAKTVDLDIPAKSGQIIYLFTYTEYGFHSVEHYSPEALIERLDWFHTNA